MVLTEYEQHAQVGNNVQERQISLNKAGVFGDQGKGKLHRPGGFARQFGCDVDVDFFRGEREHNVVS